jgi:UDP-N-acetyl-D-galactosamine dehydrogenase
MKSNILHIYLQFNTKVQNLDITKIINGNRVVYDVKGVLGEEVIDGKL